MHVRLGHTKTKLVQMTVHRVHPGVMPILLVWSIVLHVLKEATKPTAEQKNVYDVSLAVTHKTMERGVVSHVKWDLLHW
jgi:hypothetical protein